MKENVDRVIEACRRLGLMVNSPPGRARLTALVYRELNVNKFVSAAIVLGMFGRNLEEVPGLHPQDRGAAEAILNEYPALTHINGASKMVPSQSLPSFHFEMELQKLISGGPDILAEMTAAVPDAATEPEGIPLREPPISPSPVKKPPLHGHFAGENRACSCGKTFWAWRRTCIRCSECVEKRKTQQKKRGRPRHVGKVSEAGGDGDGGKVDGSADGS